MSTHRIRFTRANALTLLRVVLVPVFALAILASNWGLAAVVFWAAVATDVADGRVARRYGEVTEIGALIDHSADALFVSVGAAALAIVGALPVALAPLILLAFLQYAVDSRLMGHRELRASRLGRWNGVAYYVAVATPIMRDAFGFDWPGSTLVIWFGWALVASTALSMASRLRALLAAE